MVQKPMKRAPADESTTCKRRCSGARKYRTVWIATVSAMKVIRISVTVSRREDESKGGGVANVVKAVDRACQRGAGAVARGESLVGARIRNGWWTSETRGRDSVEEEKEAEAKEDPEEARYGMCTRVNGVYSPLYIPGITYSILVIYYIYYIFVMLM